MATVIAGMAVSLDGFVADPNGSADPLYPHLVPLRDTPYMRSMIERTGAVLMGKRTFEMGDPDSYVGDYGFQVPIFVVTHRPPRRNAGLHDLSPECAQQRRRLVERHDPAVVDDRDAVAQTLRFVEVMRRQHDRHVWPGDAGRR